MQILTSIRGNNQVTFWFFWFLFVFVIGTLLTEINYLNKALELFNTALVTPTYFVTFTTFTLVTSIILYQGLKATAIQLITMFLGFLVICVGITILQMSKGASWSSLKSGFSHELTAPTPSCLQWIPSSWDPPSTASLRSCSPLSDRPSPRRRRASKIVSRPEKLSPSRTLPAADLARYSASMDALRGGYVIGSIMRARSRRASGATNNGSIRGRASSTAFDPTDPFSLNMTRYALSDPPSGPNHWSNPDDNRAPSSDHEHGRNQFLSPQPIGGGPPRSGSALRFDPEDTVHRPGRAGHPEEATHTREIHGDITSPRGSFRGQRGSETLSPHSSFSRASGQGHAAAVGTFSTGDEREERSGGGSSGARRFQFFGPRHAAEPPASAPVMVSHFSFSLTSST